MIIMAKIQNKVIFNTLFCIIYNLHLTRYRPTGLTVEVVAYFGMQTHVLMRSVEVYITQQQTILGLKYFSVPRIETDASNL